MKWVSIEDKLPDENSWVLVYADGAMNCMGFYKGVWRDWTQPQSGNIIISSITHWMELPNRPVFYKSDD